MVIVQVYNIGYNNGEQKEEQSLSHLAVEVKNAIQQQVRTLGHATVVVHDGEGNMTYEATVSDGGEEDVDLLDIDYGDSTAPRPTDSDLEALQVGSLVKLKARYHDHSGDEPIEKSGVFGGTLVGNANRVLTMEYVHLGIIPYAQRLDIDYDAVEEDLCDEIPPNSFNHI